jgi:hypothetical protein
MSFSALGCVQNIVFAQMVFGIFDYPIIFIRTRNRTLPPSLPGAGQSTTPYAFSSADAPFLPSLRTIAVIVNGPVTVWWQSL